MSHECMVKKVQRKQRSENALSERNSHSKNRGGKKYIGNKELLPRKP